MVLVKTSPTSPADPAQLRTGNDRSYDPHRYKPQLYPPTAYQEPRGDSGTDTSSSVRDASARSIDGSHSIRTMPSPPPPYLPLRSPRPGAIENPQILTSSEVAEQFALSSLEQVVEENRQPVTLIPNRFDIPDVSLARPVPIASPAPYDRQTFLSSQAYPSRNLNTSSPHMSPSIVSQQPSLTRQMELEPGGHRNASGRKIGSDGDRDWSYEFFDCFSDSGTCWLSCFCPCMVYATNKKRLEHLTKYNSPEPSRNGGDCGSDCMIHAILIFLSYGWSMQIGTRAAIRTRYHIRGGGWSDCCRAYWCTPCQLTQESRELELEEQSLWGWARRVERKDGVDGETIVSI